MITSYEDAERYFGRKADKNRKIYNGMLKTYFYQFLGRNHRNAQENQDSKRKKNLQMKIIFATGNKNKMIEIRQILQDLGMEILSMKEAGVDIDIVENGKSFEENAMIKAAAIAELPEVKAMDAIVLADDSGLEIDYLNKEPGNLFLHVMQEPILRMISRTASCSRE